MVWKFDIHIKKYNRVEDKSKHVNRELKYSRIHVYIVTNTVIREQGGWMIDCNLYFSLKPPYQSEFSADKRNCFEYFKQKGI